MSFESGGGQRFPYTYDQVFSGLLVALQRIEFTIKSHDKDIGRIECSTGMSLLSWGENISITVEEIDSDHTRVNIQSGLKVTGRQAAITAEGRNAKNVSKIIAALSSYLKSQPKIARPSIHDTSLDDLSPVPRIAVTSPVPRPPPPKMSFFLYLNDEVKGPFSVSQIEALLQVASVTSETQCCPQGLEEWKTIADYIS